MSIVITNSKAAKAVCDVLRKRGCALDEYEIERIVFYGMADAYWWMILKQEMVSAGLIERVELGFGMYALTPLGEDYYGDQTE